MDDFRRAEVAAQYAEVKAQIEALSEVKARLRDVLLEDGIGTRPAGNLKVQVSDNTRLNTKAFEKAYPAEQFPLLYKSAPNTAAIRAALSEEHVAQFFPSTGVVVKVLDA